ncbi:D-galactarate dehydratase [Nereida sp. MMG025]|uniref:D-galactarate dehydratase n=1 Tax=Nereida sp. MMG025 TaxID=2909981 RepID=UPI001F2788DF|nr:D-galactarate dehydratase [Nereida sp. MMG025]MCF6445274.1 D-galactarate dehydratase [Nereida sp. MMG025]
MKYAVMIMSLGLAGCAQLAPQTAVDSAPNVEDAAQSDSTRPQARPAALNTSVPKPPPPPTSARTVEQFDTSTAQERAEVVQAAAKPPEDTTERALGSTIATLGSPTDPGFWLATPLVSEVAEGRVTYQGKSVVVELRPIDGPATAGSRLSLPAMRLIGAPLTGLPEVQVFRR